MIVLYKCKCMQDQVGVEIRPRGSHENIEDWMIVLSEALSSHHKNLNSNCMETKMEYVKIPISENSKGIGMAPILDS